MSRALIPLFLLVVLLGGGGYYLLNNQKMYSPVPIPLPQGHVCEPDTMVCEDGTVLKREGPNCDFPPCPASGSADSSSPLASPVGEEITISGTINCLPHKNTSGPQTLECAMGLEAVDGNNYALADPEWKYLTGVGNGTKVKIIGNLTKKSDTKYDSVGLITIQSLVKI